MSAGPEAAPLALTQGDPAGVGPEIALRAWSALKETGPAFAIYGDPGWFAREAERLGLPAPLTIEHASQARDGFSRRPAVIPVELAETPRPGRPSGANAPGVIAAIERACADALSGAVRGVVTCPIAKSVLYEAGFIFPGHTEFVAHLTREAALTGARGPIMMLAAPGLRVSLVSIHVSLRDALSALTSERIVHTARVTAEALKTDFAIERPRLAVAGLNPHAGEGGALGREEIEIVAPAVERLRADGFDVTGPLPPDTMFHAEARARYDAAVCLYHDQGLIPVKTLDFHGGVNITLGLPIVRASPDHGTAFDIAGTGAARPDSLIAALTLAGEMGRNRERARTGARSG